jgi:uncharacterized beta-barrel protein YwiB (DUF1934 family)
VNKKALISVKTLQYINGQPESIELITQGEYYRENNDFFAIYEETEISGMEGTKTTLKIQPDSLTIIRHGTTNTNLLFKKGLNHVSLYNTPYGTLEVTVRPSKVLIDVGDTGGKVELRYKMEAPGLEIIENELELNIKEVN